MTDRILKEIDRLETEKELRVLLACETGSRAWGFPSPDSDYDVRLIYMNKKEWYHTLFEGKDNVEYMSKDREIDLTGWDLRKTLRLLWKSNPALLERLQSPIVYEQDQDCMDKLKQLAPRFYSKRATLHHYLNMARKSLDVTTATDYRLKALFYALRAASVCRWIFANDQCPPIVFTQVLEGIDLSRPLRNRISELIELKSGKSESYMHSGDEELISWIAQALDRSAAEADKLSVAKGDIRELDELLFHSIS